MKWMLTAEVAGRKHVDGVDVTWPSSVAHARAIDSEVTVCGQTSAHWTTFWSLDFPAAGAPTCASCLCGVSRAREAADEPGAREHGSRIKAAEDPAPVAVIVEDANLQAAKSTLSPFSADWWVSQLNSAFAPMSKGRASGSRRVRSTARIARAMRQHQA